STVDHRPNSVEIRLPVAVLARGTVVDARTAAPVARAAVQYLAESQNNKHVPEDVVTGWQNMQFTDDRGKYEIAVPPGPGTLTVHGPVGSNHVVVEKGSNEIEAGQPGGQRYYAHAFARIAPPVPNAAGAGPPFDVAPIPLQPGGVVAVKLVDPDGKPVDY